MLALTSPQGLSVMLEVLAGIVGAQRMTPPSPQLASTGVSGGRQGRRALQGHVSQSHT